jgi:endo-1,4-beta-xylanase
MTAGAMVAPLVNCALGKAGLGVRGPASAFATGWGPAGDAGTLRAAGEGRGLLVGSAISAAQIGEAELAELIARECSIVVAENDMKWKWTQPEAKRYDFTRPDAVMAFAEKNGLQARGHNLCWHQSLPDWVEQTATKENAARILREHVMTVAGRYAGKMQSWDVVNEAIELKDGRRDGLRDSMWMRLLGPGYLAIAYRSAAEADPKAKLTYNDYGLEGDGKWSDERRGVALGLLRWFRENQIPLHALGLQSHLQEKSSGDYRALNHFLDEVSKMGLEVYVTELDVKMEGSGEPAEKAAAKVYKEYLENVLKHPAVKAVLTWGLTSRGRKNEERLLPFGDGLQPTPAFYAMEQALRK